MGFIKNKIFILALVYLLTRIINLTLLPISNDEANYIYWAKNIAETGAGWFISLTAGKPPLLIWIMAAFVKIFPSSWYLFAGRLPSVIFGLVGFFGVYKLGGKFAALLYLFSPFVLFYDRLALLDSMLSAMLIWTVYFMLSNRPKLWGIFLGLSFLSKPTAIIFAALTPAIYFLKNIKVKPIIIALTISQILANFLIISKGYGDYLPRSIDYHPNSAGSIYSTFINNLPLTLHWLGQYLTWPVFILGIFSLFKIKNKTWAILFFIPIIAFTFMARIYFPRYFLFAVPYLFIALGVFIVKFKYKYLLIFVLTIPCLLFDYFLIFNPVSAPLPEIESWQYVTGYPSSYGFEPIYKYLEKEKSSATIFVQGGLSHFPNAFKLYFWNQKNLKFIEDWNLKIDNQVLEASQSGKVYFVVRDNEKVGEINTPQKLNLPILITGSKPGGKDSVYLLSH